MAHYFSGEQRAHDLEGMLVAIDKAQPKDQRLGGFLTAEEVETTEVRLGDRVYVRQTDSTYKPFTVIGYGEVGSVVNGCEVAGVPYVQMYGDIGYSNNINNYLRQPTVRRVPGIITPVGEDVMRRILARTDELRACAREHFQPDEGVYRIADSGTYVSEEDWENVWADGPTWWQAAWLLADNGQYTAEDVARMTIADVEDVCQDPNTTFDVAFYTQADEHGLV